MSQGYVDIELEWFGSKEDIKRIHEFFLGEKNEFMKEENITTEEKLEWLIDGYVILDKEIKKTDSEPEYSKIFYLKKAVGKSFFDDYKKRFVTHLIELIEKVNIKNKVSVVLEYVYDGGGGMQDTKLVFENEKVTEVSPASGRVLMEENIFKLAWKYVQDNDVEVDYDEFLEDPDYYLEEVDCDYFSFVEEYISDEDIEKYGEKIEPIITDFSDYK